MATANRNNEVDRVDQLLGMAIFIFVSIAVFCIVVYSVGNLSDSFFDFLYPEKI